MQNIGSLSPIPNACMYTGMIGYVCFRYIDGPRIGGGEKSIEMTLFQHVPEMHERGGAESSKQMGMMEG